MSSKTFYRITNKDIYNSIIELHNKHDENSKIIALHNQKIRFHSKTLFLLISILTTIGGSIIAYGITGG